MFTSWFTRSRTPTIVDVRTRVVIAKYDYDPSTMSPNIDAEQVELAFCAGDPITIHGEKDCDGFYVGELNGIRGLVPCNFLVNRGECQTEIVEDSNDGSDSYTLSVSCVDAPLNIDNLPPEIILIIVRLGEESLEEMRLISPTWNWCVLEHLSNWHYKPVLERLHLRAAMESDFENEDDDADHEGHFIMRATVPKHCAPARIGLDKWLRVQQTLPEAIEVTSGAPLKIQRKMLSEEILKTDDTINEIVDNELTRTAVDLTVLATAVILATRQLTAPLGFALLAIAPVVYFVRSIYVNHS